MEAIRTLSELGNLYDQVVPAAVEKVVNRLTPMYRKWITSSRFLILATVGPEGVDASPRGDIEPVVRVADDRHLLLPDWRGNNRLDSLKNIIVDGRASLLFMIPGCNNVVRINGTAILTADEEMTSSFRRQGKAPKTVIVMTIKEVYFQCAKALMRSSLWSGEGAGVKLPTAGDFIKEFEAGFDADGYDEGYPEYARDRLW